MLWFSDLTFHFSLLLVVVVAIAVTISIAVAVSVTITAVAAAVGAIEHDCKSLETLLVIDVLQLAEHLAVQ